MLWAKAAGAGGTIGGGGVTAPLYTGGYLASAGSTADSSSYNFTSMAIGTAASDRLVLVTAHYFTNSYTVPTATIGGASTTRVAATYGPFECQVSLHRAIITSGDTATINISFTTAPLRCAISVYAFYGLSSETEDSYETDGGGLDIASTNLSTTAGGLVFHAGSNFGGASGVWTNLTPSLEGENESQYYSSGFTTGTGSSMPVSLDAPGTNRVSLLSATWS